MSAPPPYPRIPHLVAGRGTCDDVALSAAEAADLLAAPVVVEEKVDGANVVVWLENGRVEVALRAGPGAMDRAGQLGPLRAWAAAHDHFLRAALEDDATALYAEWLLLTHSTPYDRLPSYFVVLDLWRVDRPGFLPLEERDARAAAAGLTTPPRVSTGVLGKVEAVERLLGSSAWGAAAAEGLIVRSVADSARRAKLVPVAFRRLSDDEWRRGRPQNRLVAAEGAAWR